MAFHMTAEAAAKLRAVSQWITEDARRINIEQWQTRDREPEPDTPACGTVCCIAGWLELFDRVDDRTPEAIKNAPLLNTTVICTSVPARAAQILGAEYTWDVENLFYPDQWDGDLQRELAKTTPRTPEHAVVVVKAIERFISDPHSFGYNQSEEDEDEDDYWPDEDDDDDEDILDESKAEAEAKLD